MKFRAGKTIIQFDIDTAEIDKNVPTDLSVMADVNEILKTLVPLLEQADRREWLREVNAYRDYEAGNFDSTLPAYKILSALGSFTDADTPVRHGRGAAPDVDGAVLQI